MTIPKKQQEPLKRCQKCLKHGHWSYECKKPYKVRVRPSRSKLLKNYIKTVERDENGCKIVTRTKITDKSSKSKCGPSSKNSDSDSSTSSSSSSSSSSDDSSSSSDSSSTSSDSSDSD